MKISNIIARHTSRNAGTTSPHMGGLGGRSRMVFSLVFLALLISCSSDDQSVADRCEIRLQGSISVEPLSKASDNLFTSYFDDDKVAVNISEQTTGTSLYSLTYTAKSDGSLNSPVNTNGETVTPYFPASGKGVDIYALYPSTATSGNFAVESDQTSDDSYKASDLMYAKASSQASDEAIPLKFAHQLAKVTITLKADGQSITTSQLDGAVVKLINVSTSIPVTVDKSSLTLGTISNGTDKIKIFKVADGNLTGSCIVPPQSLSTTQFAQVIIGYKTFIASLPSSPSWSSGLEYKYTINVAYDAVEVSSATIVDWKGNDAQDVEASTSIIGTKKASNAVVGDYYMSDGSLVGKDETLTGYQIEQCIGVVFCTDANRIGDAEKEALAEKGVTTPHGLVLAKTHAGKDVKWGPLNTTVDGITVSSTQADMYNDINGLSHNQVIWDNYSLDDYPVFKAAKEYNNVVPAPENTTGWFLPSIGQWWDIYVNICGVSSLDNCKESTSTNNICIYSKTAYTYFNNVMNKMGGETLRTNHNYIWTSSVKDANSARLALIYQYENERIDVTEAGKQGNDDDAYCILAF